MEAVCSQTRPPRLSRPPPVRRESTARLRGLKFANPCLVVVCSDCPVQVRETSDLNRPRWGVPQGRSPESDKKGAETRREESYDKFEAKGKDWVDQAKRMYLESGVPGLEGGSTAC
jgi:hypothetical protein